MSFSKFFGLWHFDQALWSFFQNQHRLVEVEPVRAWAASCSSALPCVQSKMPSLLLYHGSGFRCSTEAPFRGLREEEQDLLHGLVLPSGCHGRCRALQHCAWVLIHDSGVYGLVTKPPSGLVYLCMALPVATLTKVLCVHSLLEHTDVTIMYDNEALYDICRRSLVHPCH